VHQNNEDHPSWCNLFVHRE